MEVEKEDKNRIIIKEFVPLDDEEELDPSLKVFMKNSNYTQYQSFLKKRI